MPKTQDYQIKGNYNYFVDFQVKGGIAPFQNCILSANAFSKPDKKCALAIKCSWSRSRGSRAYNLLGINSNTYQLSAQDIGATIELEVTPQEEGFKGCAVITFGPISLDPNVKVTLEGILAAGGSKFPINLMIEDTGTMMKESAALLLTNEFVRVVLNVNDREERSLKFRYNLEEPDIEMNNLDTTMMAMNFRGVFEEDMPVIMRFLHENRLNVSRVCRFTFKTVSKISRDLIYLALKCFAAKTFLVDSKLISNIESIFVEGKLFSSKIGKGGTLGDLLLEVEGLKKEVSYLLKHNHEISGEKETLSSEIKSLEKELSETIEAYSQMIMELKTTGNIHNNESMMLEMSMVGRRDELFYKNEVKKLNEEKKRLIEKISMMTEELELNRHFNKNEGFFSESRIWTKNNDEEKITNKKKNFDESRILQSPHQDLEAALLNISELKARNNILENKVNEYKQMFEKNNMNDSFRNQNGNNLKLLENKLQETKKLNEMLLTELNESRKKSHNSDFEQQVTKLSHQYQQKCAEYNQIETDRDTIQKEYEVLKIRFATIEAEHHENKRKIEFFEGQKYQLGSTSDIYSKFELEKTNLNNEIFNLRSKNTKFELDSNEFQRKKESLESQIRTIKSKCETIEFENQVLRKENESLKSHETNYSSSQDDRVQLKAAEARFFELKSKYDMLLSEHENMKMKLSEASDRSFRVADYFSKDNDNQLKYDNERLKLEIKGLLSRNEELTRNIENLKLQIQVQGGGQITTSNNSNNLQEHKIKSLQKLLEDSCAVNDKNLKEIIQLKRENQELRSELDLLRKTANYNSGGYNSNKMNDTSFMLNRTVTYELEAENESLKHKLSSLELMISDYKTKFAMLQKENDNFKKDIDPLKNMKHSQDAVENEVMKSRLMTNELLVNDYKAKLEQAVQEVNSLRNENALLKAEIDELNKGRSRMNILSNDALNRSFRENSSSLNRTFQAELEMENENLKKNLSSVEGMLQDYKNNVKIYFEKNQSLEKMNAELQKEIQEIKTRKTGGIVTNESFENKQLLNKIEDLKKDCNLKLEQAVQQVNSLRNENALLKAEIDELNKGRSKMNILSNDAFNRSFRENSQSLNRTFQAELETENENLKKNLSSVEGMLQDYKNNVRIYFEKNQSLEKEIQELKNRKTGGIGTNDNFENKQLLNKIEDLKKELKDNGMVFDNFKVTNQRLMAENNKLMEMVRRTQDEMDGLKSRSRIMDASFMGDMDVMGLREKVAELQKENEMINNEKDKLLVELSKIMAQQL